MLVLLSVKLLSFSEYILIIRIAREMHLMHDVKSDEDSFFKDNYKNSTQCRASYVGEALAGRASTTKDYNSKNDTLVDHCLNLELVKYELMYDFLATFYRKKKDLYSGRIPGMLCCCCHDRVLR